MHAFYVVPMTRLELWRCQFATPGPLIDVCLVIRIVTVCEDVEAASRCSCTICQISLRWSARSKFLEGSLGPRGERVGAEDSAYHVGREVAL